MKATQKNTTHRIPIVDFVPAELKKGKVWRIEYYISDPTEKSPLLKRKQLRVKPMPNHRERERFAKRICFELNRKLELGWNPIIEQEAPQSLIMVKDVISKYIRNIEKQVKDKSLREDTLRAYRSYLKNFQMYLEKIKQEDLFCLKFERQLIGDFLDYIYYERDNSPRTYNNYLGFLNVFSKYMIQKGHIKANPAEAYSKKKNGEKKRIVFEKKDLTKILNKIKEVNPYYYTACTMVYFEFVRRTEMSKLLVSDINLKNRTILLRGEISKNNKTQSITILKEFIPIITEHLKDSKSTDYVFSSNNYKPGPNKEQPKAFSVFWSKLRKAYNWNKLYQFYGLKDTGITNLLEAGVSIIHVKDHARHHAIEMTMQYVPHNTTVNREHLDGILKI